MLHFVGALARIRDSFLSSYRWLEGEGSVAMATGAKLRLFEARDIRKSAARLRSRLWRVSPFLGRANHCPSVILHSCKRRASLNYHGNPGFLQYIFLGDLLNIESRTHCSFSIAISFLDNHFRLAVDHVHLLRRPISWAKQPIQKTPDFSRSISDLLCLAPHSWKTQPFPNHPLDAEP